ncbi:hypothetical protein [Nocardioides nitrophenolicus]|uniref:hypothetical protein n=1 Tax=Nocardioides nitrophenolicus TaxID=60489 RepID=UPI0019571847|nr:hypothetical protein [Nocardioides nitrophenolicus]MBM7517740.1 hypothetical protein [Nocardioides nitrophenolicus]
MWEQYDAPDERPGEKPAEPAPAREQPLLAPDEFGPVGARGGGSATGVLIGILVVIAVVVIGAVASSAEWTGSGADHSDWYDCIAEQEADGTGLLSPAELCDIGHERPPGYVDTYEYDPLGDDGYGG